ncbi:MAG: UbiX family flavin prenyltransferase [Planctomycetes bacterium]|nr:UbiX family flavin prenyltransferase [Planctomycetota bacterium]
MARDRWIVGISGGSGPVMGIRLLQALRQYSSGEVHLVVTPSAVRTLQIEAPEWSLDSLKALAHVVHDFKDVAAAPASGTWKAQGMAVIPASMHTCAAIAHSLADNLLVRAADVCLKERRRLVIVPRETPLHLGHLRTLVTLAELGASIVPPMPGFYTRPKTIDDVINQVVGKVLDQLGIDHDIAPRWEGPQTHGG